MNFNELPSFIRDVNNLRKKFRSIRDDLNTLKELLDTEPRGFIPGIIRIANTGHKDIEVYKVKHFRCSTLKGKGAKSGIRIIYIYEEENDRIVFIQAYYHKKADTDYNKRRITEYIDIYKP